MNLAVAQGEFVTLLGPSGCGKTTTLNLIAGFIPADSGHICLPGQPVGDRPPFRRDLGLVFQDYALFPHMTVAENVGFGLKMRKVKTPEIGRRVGEALAMVQLTGLEARRPLQLSGGQRQRVALARALVIRPAMLLLDEPLSNLDLKLREEMRVEISALQRRLGIATVFVTHDQGEALTMSDRIAVMRERVHRADRHAQPTSMSVRRPISSPSFIGAINTLASQNRSARCDRPWTSGDSAGPALARLPSGLATGAAVTMTVRPERLRLAAENVAPEGGTAWPASVESVIYLGARRELRVRLTDGTLAIVEAANDGQRVVDDRRQGHRVVHAGRCLDHSGTLCT